MSFGSELVQSAEEALAIAKGDIKPGRVFHRERIDVARIRKQLGLSQVAFAERFGLLPATIRDWEQDRRSPDRAATVLLKVIENEPEAVARALAR